MPDPTELERAVARALCCAKYKRLHNDAPGLRVEACVNRYWTEHLDDARAAIRECFLWRPIETAINDGQILAFVPTYYQGKGAVIVATWLDWRELGCGWYDNRGWLVEPTHWMPLPPPPDDADG